MHACHTQGVPEGRVSAEVATVLRRTSLPLEMADRPAGQYSGGSKRKLALGLALVGGSSTILLDEPSSGMVRSLPLACALRSLWCPATRHAWSTACADKD